MINEVDVDARGTIEFPEFLSLMVSHTKDTDQDSEIIAAFRLFDTKDTGCISICELRRLMQDVLNEEEIDELMEIADTNGLGEVRYEEFIRRMTERYK